jgi:hypothetical protein
VYDYLFLWRDIGNNSLVASGIQFRDLAWVLEAESGLFLLDHKFADANSCPRRLDFLSSHYLSSLVADDIYEYGDFIWVDTTLGGGSAPCASDADLAALLFFGHTGTPLGRISLPSIGNRYMGHQHDDGWFLRLYSESWTHIDEVVRPLVATLLTPEQTHVALDVLATGSVALWIDGTGFVETEPSDDIDSVLTRHRPAGDNARLDNAT